MPANVTLSLIAHTNVGKTTLARTLLRRDVGEVRDREHVTEVSEAHTLIETGEGRLLLWDTPGFGNLRTLMARLRQEGNPLGWFLHQVWDRFADRPLWCSQEAVRNIRDEADVVLYLVNASEEPAHAGYVPPELELLGWIGRPVLLLLNQIDEDHRVRERLWREHVKRWPIVHDVLSLDAFTRCWPQEGELLRRIVPLLETDKRAAMPSLIAAWNSRNLEVFEASCARIAVWLAETAADRETPPRRQGGVGARLLPGPLQFHALERKRAMQALSERLDRRTRELMETLIEAHGLVGDSAAQIERRVQDFQVNHGAPFDERSGAVAGAVLSGALGGLAADALSGGLSLGGGMIAGGILGALGGSALARGYRMIGGDTDPAVQWAPEFLDQLARQGLLRYLAVAHFGRGRGAFEDVEQPAHWSDAVETALAGSAADLQRAWRRAAKEPADTAAASSETERLVQGAARRLLADAYPESGVFEDGLRP